MIWIDLYTLITNVSTLHNHQKPFDKIDKIHPHPLNPHRARIRLKITHENRAPFQEWSCTCIVALSIAKPL